MKASVGFLALALAGCATSPDRIAAAYVPAVQFSGLNCEQIRAEHSSAEIRTDILRDQQQAAADHDVIMTGAALFVWPALLGIGSQGNQSAQLAQAMGVRDALRQAGTDKGCWTPAVAAPLPEGATAADVAARADAALAGQ